MRRVAAAALLLCLAASGQAAPTGGSVVAGTASVTSSGARTTITQSSPSTILNWHSFGIAAGESVQFIQPTAQSVALNRVLGADPSAIFGSLSANGKVFLVNPNGILFGSGASVNVAGLVASALDISDAAFLAGQYRFAGSGRGAVVNEGSIQADGGYVALLGGSVSNRGVITARMGTVALAAGQAITLDVAGDRLLNVRVDAGTVDALVSNGGLLQADGGLVLMTAQAAGELLSTVVNNTGRVQAQTIDQQAGTIRLLGDMRSGTVSAGGVLDASAPRGGPGGQIETSAAHVQVPDSARVTTASAGGPGGHWLIDPQDFTIGGGAGDNISGAVLSEMLVTTSVEIRTAPGLDVTVAGTPPGRQLFTDHEGNGDIYVNQPVSWSASTVPTTLTLTATRDTHINQAVTATN
ncbi:MAG: filamentous hemagglutinin N-terminal domain-containing protein, partial [Pseudoxanthomonas sp.]